MTYRRTDADPGDDTRVVERETYVERDPGYVPPAAQPAGSQVNVNAGTGRGPTYVETSPGPLYYARRILSLLFGILTVLIALRILFLLLVANPGNAIVDFVYSVTEPFVAPFRGIFALDQVVVGDSTFEVAGLVALIGWFLIYLLIMAILSLGDRGRSVPA
ncbi:MAG TPA: YggT family protein [Candidatus Limnocylindria bacterium]|nr:YggT family protein [Candidatus Limnocylindria bacterium]